MRGMSVWQMRQANECPCGGADDYCPCQNVERMVSADRQVDEIMALRDSEILALSLKPCPFCAQSVTGPIPGRQDRWDFHCRGCGAILEISAPTAGLAGRNWNTRYDATPTPKERET